MKNKKTIIGIILIILVIILCIYLFTVSKNEEENEDSNTIGNTLNEAVTVIEEDLSQPDIPAQVTYYEEVPIPEGFIYKEGSKDTGLVIQDKDKNEFVWIPIKEVTRGLSRYGYANEQFGESRWNEKLPKKLANSIEKYGGFYISRYEISKNSNGEAQSKAGFQPWVSVGQVKTEENAFDICKNMYNEDAPIRSHLIYGAQWDTTLQWLVDTGAVTLDEISKNSTSWGNFMDSEFEYIDLEGVKRVKQRDKEERLPTGITTYTMKNNIYDLAGNVWEWTQERYSKYGDSALRGGSFDVYDIYSVATYRDHHEEDQGHENIGFRVGFYIK